MIRPGKMIYEVIGSIFKKSATLDYPQKPAVTPERFRGKLHFDPDKCIGCKLCMRDCPSGAITINKISDEPKRFEAVINLDRCIFCAQCVDSCNKDALSSGPEFELAQVDKNKLTITYTSAGADAAASKNPAQG